MREQILSLELDVLEFSSNLLSESKISDKFNRRPFGTLACSLCQINLLVHIWR